MTAPSRVSTPPASRTGPVAAPTGSRLGGREEPPGDEPKVREQHVRRATRVHLGDALEEHREDDHEQEWREDRPRVAEVRLLVPGPEIPLGDAAHHLTGPDELADGATE